MGRTIPAILSCPASGASAFRFPSVAVTLPSLVTFKPRTFFLVAIAGWTNRQQQDAIAHLRTENRILREKLGQTRILLNESQKRRLATAAMKLGEDLLRQCGTLFSPDTLIRWNRMLKGLTRYLVFFVIEIATRKVEIVGIHADPCETQMLQWARNLTERPIRFLA